MADAKGGLPLGATDWSELSVDQVFIPERDSTSSAPELDEQAVVTLVVQDFNTAIAFMNQQEWFAQWRDTDILYQSPLLYDSADPDRARVSRFTVNNDVNTMADAVKSGLFAQNPCFFLRKRGATTDDQLKGWQALLAVLLDRMKFSYWAGLGIHSQTSQGTGVWKGGWSTRSRTVYKRKQTAEPTQVEMPTGNTEAIHTTDSDSHNLTPVKITESYPWLEYRQLGTTLFDPAWRTPNAPEYCGYAIDVDYVTWRDLQEMSLDSNYTIPDLDALKEWFFRRGKESAEQGSSIENGLSESGSPVMHAADRNRPTTADPLAQPIQMLSRWDSDRALVVLRIDSRYVVIQNHEHGLGRIPHFTANWRNIDNSGFGIGIGRLVGSDQRVEQGVLNHALNLLGYQMNPAILYLMGSGNAPTGNRTIRAGGFFGVSGDDVRKGWGVAEMPAVPAEAWQMIQYSRTSSQETSGADATFMQGALGGKGSSAARTATGAGRIAAKSDARVQTPVENIEIGLVVPWVHMLINMVRMYMPLKEIREIVGNKLGATLADQIVNQAFLEAELEAEVLAGAKLAAKAAMAAQIPYLMQVLQQPQLLEQLHQEGKTIDVGRIIDVLFEVSEYRMEDTIVRPMTDPEKQHMQALAQMQSGAGPKGQAELQKEQMRGQNELAVEDSRGKHAIARTVIEKELERNGGGNPLIRAAGLVDRSQDEQVLNGAGPSALAGV